MFAIAKLTHPSVAYENITQHNKQDFNNKISLYIEIKSKGNCVVYRSEHNDAVSAETLCLNAIMKQAPGFSDGSEVRCKEKTLKPEKLTILELEITIPIRCAKWKMFKQPIYADDILEYIFDVMKDDYFLKNQFRVMQIDDRGYGLKVINGTGTITKDTKIILSTDIFQNIKLINSQVRICDLFAKNVDFNELGIGGLDRELTELLKSGLSSRAVSPELIRRFGTEHIRGLLLHGKPGTGKTLIARNIGKLLTEVPVKVINGPEMMSKFVGESEKKIRELFDDATNDFNLHGDRAQLHVIIFDEIDAFCRERGSAGGVGGGVRDSMVNQLLTMLDGINSTPNVFVIGMTNRKDLIDEALLRPGRIEIHIEIGVPDKQGRKDILLIHTKTMMLNGILDDDVNLDTIADMTKNFTGAELSAIIKKASQHTLYQLLMDGNDKEYELAKVNMQTMVDATNDIIRNRKETSDGHMIYLSDDIIPTENQRSSGGKILEQLIKRDSKMNSFTLTGKSGSGKTTILKKMGLYLIDHNYKAKLIRGSELIDYSEAKKIKYIRRIFNFLVEQNNKNDGILILDDMELIINFATSNYFSSKLYGLILSIIKSRKCKIVFSYSNRRIDLLFDDMIDYHIELQ